MRHEITIENYTISEGSKPYIIAEVSGNHNGSIEKALRLIEIAKESGADAVKLLNILPIPLHLIVIRMTFK